MHALHVGRWRAAGERDHWVRTACTQAAMLPTAGSVPHRCVADEVDAVEGDADEDGAGKRDAGEHDSAAGSLYCHRSMACKRSGRGWAAIWQCIAGIHDPGAFCTLGARQALVPRGVGVSRSASP